MRRGVILTAIATFGLGGVTGYAGASLFLPTERAPEPVKVEASFEPQRPRLRCDCRASRERAYAQEFEACGLRLYLAGTAEPFPEPTQVDGALASQQLEELLQSCPELLDGARTQLLCDEFPCLALLDQANAVLDREPGVVDSCPGLRVGHVISRSDEHTTTWLVALMPTGWPPPEQREQWHRRWRARQLILSRPAP